MNDTNLVVLTGRLTRDVDLRYTPKGTALADISIAVNGSEKSGEEWKERTDFVNVTVWGRQAETCKEYISKGSQVLVEGTLRLDKWETKEGEKRSTLKVVAGNVQFLGGKAADKEFPE